MKTTKITVNAECPGCGAACPPKLGIPGDHQRGWVWDERTEQRWCRACHADLEAKRHFELHGWVWKVTEHDVDGDRWRYADALSDHDLTSEAWGRATVTIVFDPDRRVMEDVPVEEWLDAAEALDREGPVLMMSEGMAEQFQEELYDE